MRNGASRSGSKDKLLFTPGPLTTSMTVKQAMLRDLGSRDSEFIRLVKDIRSRLLEIGGVGDGGYEAIIMQGSGTFTLEAVVSSIVPPDGKMLVIINGAYGRRIAQIAEIHNIRTTTLEFPENRVPDLEQIEKTLETDAAITMLRLAHPHDRLSGVQVIIDEDLGHFIKRFTFNPRTLDVFVQHISVGRPRPVYAAEGHDGGRHRSGQVRPASDHGNC